MRHASIMGRKNETREREPLEEPCFTPSRNVAPNSKSYNQPTPPQHHTLTEKEGNWEVGRIAMELEKEQDLKQLRNRFQRNGSETRRVEGKNTRATRIHSM